MEKTEKVKRAPSSWAKAVAEHIKAGGKFPKKGSEDYDKVKKLMDGMKAPTVEKKEEPVAETVKETVTEPTVTEVPKKKGRGPGKPKTALMVDTETKQVKTVIVPKKTKAELKAEVAEPVVEKVKKTRAPRKPKADIESVVLDFPTPTPEPESAPPSLRISQTIPLSRLQNTHTAKQFGF